MTENKKNVGDVLNTLCNEIKTITSDYCNTSMPSVEWDAKTKEKVTEALRQLGEMIGECLYYKNDFLGISASIKNLTSRGLPINKE